jgi:hypothetical protein
MVEQCIGAAKFEEGAGKRYSTAYSLAVDWEPLPKPSPGGWRVILADPPWRFKSNSERVPGRNPMRHYRA